MPYDNLHEYIDKLDRLGELKRITETIDPELEITEITNRVHKNCGPALLFEKVKGSRMPVITNAFGTMKRMCMALGVDDLEDIANEIRDIIKIEAPSSFIGKLSLLPKLAKLASFLPKEVNNGICKEVIIKDNPDLGILPVLKCWPGDGGRFITLPMVFTKNPETGTRNVGMYRMQVFDHNTTGMHWHTHKVGAEHYKMYCKQKMRMPVAVALGGDPAIIYSATAPLPAEFDEMLFAGFLRKKGVEMVRCETIPLQVPASSEIVLEGYVEPGEKRTEGPFGDHTGYYSMKDDYPVFHLTCITHRKDAIYPATIVGKPPMEDYFLGKATERIFLPILQFQFPEIIDINLPIEGIFHNIAIVSIRKSYPAHAKKVMMGLWGLGQMMFTKIIIVVDEDVHVQNLSEVTWRVGNNIDPKRDTIFVEGPVDALDHASSSPFIGSKVGIDATRKLPEEGYTREWPPDIKMSQEVIDKINALWNKL